MEKVEIIDSMRQEFSSDLQHLAKQLSRDFIKAHPEQMHNGVWHPKGSFWDPKSFPNELLIRLSVVTGDTSVKVHLDYYYGSYARYFAKLPSQDKVLAAQYQSHPLIRELTKSQNPEESLHRFSLLAYFEAELILSKLWENQPEYDKQSALERIIDKMNFQEENR